MRDRKEIMKKFDEAKFLGSSQIMNPEGRATVKNHKLMLEVLLDIRDLLFDMQRDE